MGKVDNYRALYEYTDGFNAYDEDKLPSDCIKCLTPKEAQTKIQKIKTMNIYMFILLNTIKIIMVMYIKNINLMVSLK